MKTKLTLLLIVMFALPTWAGVLPNDGVVGGKTMGEWAAEAWRWVLLTPTNQNANLDPDGSRANVNQPDGPVFFIGGLTQISTVIERHFTVPEGKYLFIPLISVFTDNVDTGPPPFTVEELRDFASHLIDFVDGLHASIDSLPVPELFSHRVATPVFSVDFTSPDNLYAVIAGHPVVGLDDPMVAEGYYLMIEPLPPGRHVINFGANVGPPVNLYKDITDIITVVPVPLSERVQKLISSVTASNLPGKRTRPLLRTLQGAAKSFEREHLRSGIAHLRAFQKKVRHEITRIDPALAGQLIAAAQRIIDRAEQDATTVHSHRRGDGTS